MRNKEQKGDLSVQAIAGTHVVLLGIDFPEQKCPGLLGFALRREDHTEGEKYWLSGYKTFASVEPSPPPGILYSTRQHPIQGFTWSDFSAKPEHDYTFEVFALRGTPASPEESEKVAVLYHARDDEQKISNEQAIQQFHLENICQPRNAQGLTLSHNKTIVLTKNGAAQAVLTGSTNFSVGGIYGHSNVVHICERNDVAADYLWLWNELKKNTPKSADAGVLAGKTPLPDDPLAAQITPIFSPRDTLQALDWYANQAKGANDALFMTFAFGMNQRFQDAYRTGNAKLRYALMEAMSGPTRTKAQKAANEAAIIALRRMPENKFAVGSRLGAGAFNHWLVEQLSGLNVNVRYLHTKYMLVDPLGPNPLVVSGSANFSEASTTDNDENMVIIRGNPRVADIYLGEFMRLYRHFAFRDWLTQHPEADEVQVGHLDETDQWWKRYFGDSFESRQRSYFAS